MSKTAQITWALAKHKASTGVTGLGLVLLVMTICLHAVPSISDIKIGAKALVITLLVVGLLSIGMQILSDMILSSRWPHSIVQWSSHWLSYAVYWLKFGIYLVLYGAVSVLTLASLMLAIFVVIPSLVWSQIAQVREKKSPCPDGLKPSHPEKEGSHVATTSLPHTRLEPSMSVVDSEQAAAPEKGTHLSSEG